MSIPHEKFHALTVEQVEKLLKTSSHGLTHDEVHKRLKIYGKNVLKEEKISYIQIFLRQFNSPLIFILFAAALITIGLGELMDFFVIMSVIFINSMIAFWQEIKAETTLAALKKMTETKNRVIRDGKMELIPSSELVPGDCLLLHQGEVVTADVRIIESASLIVDESIITGESLPVNKGHEGLVEENAFPFDWTNMVLTGASIARGTGRGIVVRTGNHTYLASIGEKAKEKAPETPLHMALKSFSQRFVFFIVIVLLVVGLVGFFQGRSPIDLFYILLASLVSSVPEGLPIVVTLVMVFGTILLRRKQTLVRDLPSVETLGATTIIATDKTGTITEGKLLVEATHAKHLDKLQSIAALCNDAQEGFGDALDVALTEWVENTEEIRALYPKIWEFPFEQNAMLMATAHEVDGKKVLYVKGAYEALRAKVHFQSDLVEIDDASQGFLEKGYRVLAFAEGEFTSKDPSDWKLEIVGLIGFIDPPKKGVLQAVSEAKKAGIHVIMITGDHPLTAQTIAREVGIWQRNGRVLTGKEIEEMDDETLLGELRHTTVLARILPEHKYRVVRLLQAQKEIIAVTGDGVNDIPALKVANIGIAMGNGAEAAKSVAKMILVDNNFSVIVDAIRNARVIGVNIRKVIYYLLSTSIQELGFLVLSILSGLPAPLSAIQILWINLVTDGVLDKTFALIKEEGDVMKPPKRMEEAFLDWAQMKNVLFFGFTQALFCFFLYKYLLPKYSFGLVNTILFTAVVVPQWANALQAQKENEPFFYNVKKSFTINPIAFMALPCGVLLQCAALYLFSGIFRTVPLTLGQWTWPLISFVFAFFTVELRKWIQYVTGRSSRTI